MKLSPRVAWHWNTHCFDLWSQPYAFLHHSTLSDNIIQIIRLRGFCFIFPSSRFRFSLTLLAICPLCQTGLTTFSTFHISSSILSCSKDTSRILGLMCAMLPYDNFRLVLWAGRLCTDTLLHELNWFFLYWICNISNLIWPQ